MGELPRMAAITGVKGGRRLNLYGGWRAAWPFLLPAGIGFFLFFFIPTVRGIYLSLSLIHI